MIAAPMQHGLSYTSEYRVWQTMRLRCFDPKNAAYPSYGGRGITVCERWKDSPADFLADMGKKPSAKHEIDRVDNDKGYTCGHCADCIVRGAPSNCRWATRTVNDRNRRSNRLLTYQGETHTLVEWCERLGLSYAAVQKRLAAGESDEAALGRPVRRKAPNGAGPRIHRIPGQPHANAKYSDDVIAGIRADVEARRPIRTIARERGMSATYVRKIANGRLRVHEKDAA